MSGDHHLWDETGLFNSIIGFKSDIGSSDDDFSPGQLIIDTIDSSFEESKSC